MWPRYGPDLISFNTILSAASKRRDSSMVQKILWRMEYEGIKPDVVTSTCLIQYYCSIGKVADCLKLVESMVINGHQPNTITFNTLLIGLCKNRLLGLAEGIFSRFKQIGVSPDTITYNILIRAFILEDNDLMVYELAKDMHNHKLRPNAGTYGCLVYTLCRRGKIALALHLRDQLRENGIPPDISIYNDIMKAMFMRRMFWEIISLFKDMAIDGCEPNECSYNLLKEAKLNGWMKGFPQAVQMVEFVMLGKLSWYG